MMCLALSCAKLGWCLCHLRLHPLDLLASLMKSVLETLDFDSHAIELFVQVVSDLLHPDVLAHQIQLTIVVVVVG